jgi:hypothetical protein
MGLMKRIAGARVGGLMEDGWRGRPDVDLRDWAASRGLDFRDQANQVGYLGAFTWAKELQWNVVRGELPGGERGVLLHEVKLLDPDAPGTFYGVHSKTAGFKPWHMIPGADMFSSGWEYFRAPHTTAAVRIPEGTGSLHGLHVARRSERYASGDDYWRRRDLGEFDIKGWAAVVRKRADDQVADRVLSGPIRQVLSTRREHGFTIEFIYGQLLVYQQYFLKQPEELDAFCQTVSYLAREIRAICSRSSLLRPEPFGTELPAPEWLPAVEAAPDERHILAPHGAWLERILQISRERGLAVEDPLSFHRAFPHVPVPGEAFGVLRGDGIRLLFLLERSIRDISGMEEAVDDPGGPVGTDAAVLPCAGTPDTPNGVDGVLTESGRYAVRDGILCAWRLRDAWQAAGEPVDELVTTARRLAEEAAR